MHFSEWVPPIGDFYAWVDSNGNVQNVGNAFEHAKFFKNHPFFGEEYNSYLHELERNEEDREDHLANLEPGEHPGMHRFAFDDQNSLSRFYLTIYNRGWCRLGTHHWRHAGKNKWAIDIYGREETIAKYRKTLQELKDLLGAKVVTGIVTDAKEYYQVFNLKMKKV